MTYESFLKLDIVGDPCCEECIIIDGNTQDYIDPPMTIAELGSENTLIGTYEISAIDSIKIDKHIFFTVGSNITFKAGKEILFEDTMNIFEGAEIEAIIVDCPPGFAENTIVAIPAVGRISSNTFQAVKKSVSTLMVTPNPSTGVVKFILPENKHRSNIQVIDIKGRILNNILLEQGVEQYWIDLSHYNSGIYIVKYITNGTTISRKIVLK